MPNRLLTLVARLWQCPADLPESLETEWRLVTVRWIGVVLMLPAVWLIDLSLDRAALAYALLAFAMVYNLFVQRALPSWPSLFTSGYVTSVCDGLLNVGMISVAGGFDSPIYFVTYTVTISAAMRYGYKPTILLTTSIAAIDLLEQYLGGRGIGGSFLVRSGFLMLSGVLASQLRQRAFRAQAALREQVVRAEHDALHDRLTGLPNRGFLIDRITELVQSRHPHEGRLALLVIDLNRFADVNDTLGHHHGDSVLVQVGARLRATLANSCAIARLGGDEFGVLVPGGDATAATCAAVEVQRALEAPFTVEDYELDVDASIGIAVFPQHGTDATSLLRYADVAMYVAKRSGETLAVYTPELDQHSLQRLTLVRELREAIETGELRLHFQPKLAIGTGELIGAEALVRWQRPNGIMVQPDLFIPIAEQTGLIRPLTRWVLQEALRQSGAWRESGLDLAVAVNVSMRDLHDPELPGVLELGLARWNVPADRLILEITESGLMLDAKRALAVARELSDIGVRLAIDDFGTGYSSLSYLKRLPVNELKIDRSFVGNMGSDEEDATIVRSIIGLAHDLGLSVVAEGVADTASWAALHRLGCDVAQGYLISRPLAAADFFAWARLNFPLTFRAGRSA